MKEINNIILEMIKDNKSVNEIVKRTGISHKRLFYRLSLLKLKGFNFNTKYYYNGDIVYNMKNNLEIEKTEGTSIITSKDDNEFKAMIISDLHLGSFEDRLDLLNNIYEYCSKKGINIILNIGDLIEGPYGIYKKRIDSCEEQIEYTIKNYPFDKNILNFICLGNHDYNAIKASGQDLALALQSRRHDLIPIGYGTGILNIKNDQIILRHPETISTNATFNNKIIFFGHSHKAKVIHSLTNISIYTPSLSNQNFTSNEILPGALEINLKFTNGYYTTATISHLLLTKNNIFKINEMQFNTSSGKNFSTKVIHNEENKNKVLTLEKHNTKLSQIDKFNKRYNR